MRGFPQNARAGTTFILMNNEIRWPIIRYFSNFPVSSKFWSNLQLIGFFDIGSAWPSNDLRIIENGPVKVIINLDRDPLLAGFGYGLRFPLMGYFVRIDWAYGIEKYTISNPILYISLSTDF
jgi:hemolysin activation/secretion protein